MFDLIGSTYGSAGRLPDLRGEFIRGWDNARGVDSNRTFGSSQSDEFRQHNHNAGSNTYTNIMYETPGAGNNPSTSQGNRPYRPRTIRTGGGNAGGVETRPRNIALLPCIKT